MEDAEKGKTMEWIIEAECKEDLVDGYGLIGEELIRCVDCRYGYRWVEIRNGITDSWIECRNPDGLNHDVSEDGYCYCGERKNDETG